ncbi:MAG: hypothetical protein ABIL09_18135, partial [Gemmatimonadota bacterium]
MAEDRAHIPWRRAGASAALAVLLRVAHALVGDSVVRSMYEGRLPVAALNRLIRWQALFPVDHYQVRAAAAVRGLAWALLLLGALLLGLGALRRRWGGELRRPVWGVAVPVTGLVWLLLVLQVPLLEALPHWFWHLHLTPLPQGWMAAPAAAGVLLGLAWVLRQPRLVPAHLFLLIGLGYGWQLACAGLEGRGWEALTDRLARSRGHAELARAAVSLPGPGRIAAGYDELLASGELPAFPHATRPPGPLLFLAGVERLGRLVSPDADPAARLARAAAALFPLLAYLVLVPLYYLYQRLLPPGAAPAALGLYLTMPSVTLITLHLDQCLFPLLAWSVAALFWAALEQDRAARAALAGALFYLALFASFGLLALLPALGGFAIVHCTAGRLPGRGLARLASAFAAGFLVLHGAAWAAFGYDAAARLAAGVAAHQSWKVAEWSAGLAAYLAALNTAEFALWCGPPLAALAAAEGVAAWRGRRALGLAHGAAVALVLTTAGLALLGRTAGETARLGLFAVPLV